MNKNIEKRWTNASLHWSIFYALGNILEIEKFILWLIHYGIKNMIKTYEMKKTKNVKKVDKSTKIAKTYTTLAVFTKNAVVI